jgi:uncharacterized protein YuzE
MEEVLDDKTADYFSEYLRIQGRLDEISEEIVPAIRKVEELIESIEYLKKEKMVQDAKLSESHKGDVVLKQGDLLIFVVRDGENTIVELKTKGDIKGIKVEVSEKALSSLEKWRYLHQDEYVKNASKIGKMGRDAQLKKSQQ